MRRLSTEKPIWLARATRTVAVFSLWSTLISIVLLRFHLVSTNSGLAALGASLVLAVLALFIALIAFVRIWNTGDKGIARAVSGFILALLILGPPVAFAARGLDAPPLNDITTDPSDPPQLYAARSLRAPDANSTGYDRANGDLQRKAFPLIQPLLLELPVDSAYTLVGKLVKERRWRVTSEMPIVLPTDQGRVPVRDPEGRIEAIDRSFLLGLEDDIVIRLRDVDGRTRVDMRSASRYGRYDQGVNAARVAEFLESLRVTAFIR